MIKLFVVLCSVYGGSVGIKFYALIAQLVDSPRRTFKLVPFKMFTVYVIKNVNSGKMYTGYTSDLDKRLKRHNQELPNKKSSFTSKNPGSWMLVYKEEFINREDAFFREKELKTGKGREFVKSILK